MGEHRPTIVSPSQVEKAIEAVLQVLEKRTQKQLLGDFQTIDLQFTTKKVPAKQTIKLKLPHGLKDQHAEVCLFVKDIDKADRDYEKSVSHFKAVLKSKGVTCVSEIIPLKALKLEHKPFESKRNLSNRFDIFLADARIIRLLPSYLGKAFFSRKRQPVQVRMDASNLKDEFEAAINNTRCILSGRGSVGMARVGSTNMSVAELVENITASTEQILSAIPGGATNIRNLYVKTPDSLAIPVYISSDSAKEVEAPAKPPAKERQVAKSQDSAKEVAAPAEPPTKKRKVAKSKGSAKQEEAPSKPPTKKRKVAKKSR